jgi:thiol-disulfide isomerase/thioredoxin
MSRRGPAPLLVPAALALYLLVPLVLTSCAGGSTLESAGDNGAEGSGEGGLEGAGGNRVESLGKVVPAPGSPRAGKDDPFARLSLQDPQGRTIRLGDFKGKVRLIDVWATWCGPCRMIIPHLNRLYDRYRGEGLVVIGVSVDSSPGDIVDFARTVRLGYPVGMMNREVRELLGDSNAIPTSYLIDRNGRLRRKFIGFVEPETIEREVKRFLATP